MRGVKRAASSDDVEERSRKSPRTGRAPFSSKLGDIQALFNSLADYTKRGITIDRTIAQSTDYNVKAKIYLNGNKLSSGGYDSSTGRHAEVAALANLTVDPGRNGVVLTVNKVPCSRCAVILAFFLEIGWQVRSPTRDVPAGYAGSYDIPDDILNILLIGRIVGRGIFSQNDAVHYRDSIKTEFISGNWWR